MRQRPATSLAGNLIDASEKLIEFNVVDVNVIAVLELLEGVSAAVDLRTSWPGRVITERFDVVVLQSKRTYCRFEQGYILVRMSIRATREWRDRDDILAVDFFLVELAVAFDDCREIVAPALIAEGGPAEMVFALAPFSRDSYDLAWHPMAFDDACQVVAPDSSGDDEPGLRGHRLFQL